MKRGLAVLPLLMLAACSAPDTVPEAVLLDGLFNEWSEAATILDDPPDAPDAEVDVLSVQGLDEPAWLYLALDVGNETTLQSLPGTLHLLFDVDADARTGGTAEGMDGVDLIVDLSQRLDAPPGAAARGVGFALRAVDPDGTTRALERYGLSPMAAPTWSAPRFELRLSRLGAEGVSPFGARFRLRVVYREAGETLEETEVGFYAFASRASWEESHTVREIPAKPAGATRVAQWNVADGRFTENGVGFAGLLAAIEPDVILLDELPGDMTAERLQAFFELDPLRRLGSWSFVLGETGGVQRAAVAARGRELRPTRWLGSVPYTDAARPTFAALLAEAPDEATRASVLAEPARGVSAAGAWVGVGGRPALFVAADLQSGGWSGSRQDRLRTLQANTIRERVVLELGAAGAPAVIGGDLNVVGSRDPLFALTRGLDVDGSDLVVADARRLGERTYATWRNPRDRFAPGRLDFLLVADAALTVAGAFTLAVEDLDEALLAGLGLGPGQLSDHAPVVADLVPLYTVGGDGP